MTRLQRAIIIINAIVIEVLVFDISVLKQRICVHSGSPSLPPCRFYAGGGGSEYSTAIYAELYNGSNSGGRGGERNGGAANAGYEEGDDERSEGSSNSDNSGSGSSGVNKKVKFNESVAVKVRTC